MKKSLRLQVADRIREILDEKGLKQQDLADSSGMAKSYLSRILNGSINLTLDTIELLEKSLKEPIIRCPK